MFNNKRLQLIFEKYKHSLEGVSFELNQISDDIKNLESYLTKIDIKESVLFDLNGYPYELKYLDSDFDTLQNIHNKEIPPPKSGWPFKREALRWDCKIKRIIFCRFKAVNVIAYDRGKSYNAAFYYSGEELILEKPLIECSAEIRKEVYPCLPNYLEYIAHDLEMYRKIQDQSEEEFHQFDFMFTSSHI